MAMWEVKSIDTKIFGFPTAHEITGGYSNGQGNAKIAGKSGVIVTKRAEIVAFIHDRHHESVMDMKTRLSETDMLNAMTKLIVAWKLIDK